VLSGSGFVGECDVPITAESQQTFEPGAKSLEWLTSTSYFAAPATGCHENCGSNVSGSLRRSVSFGAVFDGHSHVNDAVRDCAPRLPFASSGVTAQ
jgi:hypothetical protein